MLGMQLWSASHIPPLSPLSNSLHHQICTALSETVEFERVKSKGPTPPHVTGAYQNTRTHVDLSRIDASQELRCLWLAPWQHQNNGRHLSSTPFLFFSSFFKPVAETSTLRKRNGDFRELSTEERGYRERERERGDYWMGTG